MRTKTGGIDGRCLKRTGRISSLAVKLTPEMTDEMKMVAYEEDITLSELTEQMWSAYLAERRGRKLVTQSVFVRALRAGLLIFLSRHACIRAEDATAKTVEPVDASATLDSIAADALRPRMRTECLSSADETGVPIGAIGPRFR